MIMKKLTFTRGLVAMLSALLVFTMIPCGATVRAADNTTTIANLTYTLNDNSDGTHTATITGCSSSLSGTVTIPASITYNSIAYTVTAIGSNAFQAAISNSFSIIIEAPDLMIGDYAFNCNLVNRISISGSGSIGGIGTCAFINCSILQSVDFGVSEKLKQISEYAFVASGLTTITIPASVTLIGKGALSSFKLTCIDVATGNTAYMQSDGVLFDKNMTTLLCCPSKLQSGGGAVTSYAIPDGVTEIKDEAFSYCCNLTSVSIPGSVNHIGKNAFQYSNLLSTVTFAGEMPPIIDTGTFMDCSTLQSFKVPNSAVAAYSAILNGYSGTTVSASGDIAIDSIAEHTYTGLPITPEVTVKDASGNTLIKGIDYTVAYYNNKGPGTAIASVTGIGGHSGKIDKTFTITAPSADTTLSSLSLSCGTLNPAFSSDTTTYTANVDNSVSSITVTPTSSESHAIIKVNTTTVTSGGTSSAISLTAGTPNEIYVTVTAQDGITSKTYKITILRAAFVAPTVTPNGNSTGCEENNSGENSSISSGSSLPVPTAAPVKEPNRPVIVTAILTPKLDKTRKSTVTISRKTIKNSINKATTEAAREDRTANGIGVSLKMRNPDGTKSLAVVLTQTVLRQLIEARVQLFEVNSGLLTLNFNLDALKEIQKQSTGDVTISLTPATKLSKQAKALAGKRPIYNVTLSYVKDGKATKITDLGSGSVNLYILFSTNYFSIFGMGYTAPLL